MITRALDGPARVHIDPRAAQCTRFYVVGGMDPTMVPLVRDVCVQTLCKRGLYDEAAALIAGWAVLRDGSNEPLAWHRLLSGVRVEVSGVAA